MGEIIQFPDDERDKVVVNIYNGISYNRFALVIIDPEVGEIFPFAYRSGGEIKEAVAALIDDATARDLGFEVEVISTESKYCLADNDNPVVYD